MKKNIPPQILGFVGLSMLLFVLAKASEANLYLFSFIKLNQTSTFSFIFFASAFSFFVNKKMSLDFKDKRVDANYLIQYYLKVLLLILPAFWSAYIIMYLLSYLGIQKTGLVESLQSLFAYMSLSELNQRLNAVPVILLYFLICPLINFLFEKITQWDFLLLVFSTMTLVTIAEFINQNIPLSNFNLIKYSSIFLIPALAAYYINFKDQIQSISSKNKKILNHFASLSIILFFLSFKEILKLIFKIPPSFNQQSLYIYFSILAVVILISGLYGDGYLKVFLGSRPLKLLGTISIGIYLIYWPILVTLLNIDSIAKSNKIYLYLILLIFFGFIFHFVIIRPILALLQKLKI